MRPKSTVWGNPLRKGGLRKFGLTGKAGRNGEGFMTEASLKTD